jgi:hypothetical protein
MAAQNNSLFSLTNDKQILSTETANPNQAKLGNLKYGFYHA